MSREYTRAGMLPGKERLEARRPGPPAAHGSTPWDAWRERKAGVVVGSGRRTLLSGLQMRAGLDAQHGTTGQTDN